MGDDFDFLVLAFDVDLDDRGAERRNLPEMGGHAAGFAADVADQVGFVDHAVGAGARIGSDDADRQRMGARNGVLAVERGGDRDAKLLGEGDQRRLGLGDRCGMNGLIFSHCSSVNIGSRTLIGLPPISVLREKYVSYKYFFNAI